MENQLNNRTLVNKVNFLSLMMAVATLVACNQPGSSLKGYKVVFENRPGLYNIDLEKQRIHVYCGELNYVADIKLAEAELHSIDSAFKTNEIAAFRGDQFYHTPDTGTKVIPPDMVIFTISKDKRELSSVAVETKLKTNNSVSDQEKKALEFRDVLVAVLENNRDVKNSLDSISHYKGKPLL